MTDLYQELYEDEDKHLSAALAEQLLFERMLEEPDAEEAKTE